MIELKSVSKSFGGEKVIDDVSFNIQDGEHLCIVGKSGSGKSVLINLILGLIELDEGNIYIDGEDIVRFNDEKWQNIFPHFGVVFQRDALLDSLSVCENVGIRLIEEGKASQTEIEEKVVDSLKLVGLDGSIMEKIPSELSGGMRKRVAIARAIIHKPEYIFYDEPTTGLDPVNSDIIDKLIIKLADSHRTSIVITHDISTVKRTASKVVMLHEKKIHYHGSTEGFFNNKDQNIKDFLKRSKAFNSQSKVLWDV